MQLLKIFCKIYQVYPTPFAQGVEPFKISLRFRFKKFYFERFSSGSGSRLFKNLSSGSVRVQLLRNLEVRARLEFIETKFLRFKFGLGSLNPNFKGSGSPKKSGFLSGRGSGSGSLQNF